MIGSFWNLCRACPSMPVDKLHSEYRSTYRWHEYTGTRPDVVRRAPVPNHHGNNANTNEKLQPSRSTEDESQLEGSKFEPAMPRRKKYPELAYRTHEFIACDGHGGSADSIDSTVPLDRARSEERSGFPGSRPSRRSKSEGPPGPHGTMMNGIAPGCSPPHRLAAPRCDSDPKAEDVTLMMVVNEDEARASGGQGGLFSKAISRISTEYRLQFAWPQGKRGGKDSSKDSAAPRKSLSMGAIRPVSNGTGPAGVHKKRTDLESTREANTHELEPLVNNYEPSEKEFTKGDDKLGLRKEFKTEYKKKFRPFSQYEFVEAEGRFLRRQKEKDMLLDEPPIELPEPELPIRVSAMGNPDSWYREVIELRKKAGEYKSRGWGTELAPDHINELYSKQVELWEQVSRRSSLSALSLASTTPRSITKEEKEKENNKKSSPTKATNARTVRLQGPNRPALDNKAADNARFRKETIRHHLERTTGVDCSEDGALLPSPTREKLVPCTPRKDDDYYSPQRGSPQKGSSQKGSPQKGSPKKSSPQKASPQKSKSSPRSARSQSLGPSSLHSENLSPKRARPTSTVTAATISSAKHKKSSTVTPTASTERRPRPTSLSTTIPTGSKSISVPPKPPSSMRSEPTRKSKSSTNQSAKAPVTIDKGTGSTTRPKGDKLPKFEIDDDVSQEKDAVSISSASGSAAGSSLLVREPITAPEHVVKSPPEPTRVKSPEQIIMRSPDPVNWTVPLDTGKTFTVTQNVREGDIINRPHSEVKAWTPPDAPPPAPQSAPPELAQQAKTQAWKSEYPAAQDCSAAVHIGIINGDKTPTGGDVTNGEESINCNTKTASDLPLVIKPLPGSNIHCLDDSSFGLGTSKPDCNILEAALEKSQPLDLPEGLSKVDESPTKQQQQLSPTTGRSLASEVLEKARTRFDRFWGKTSKDGSV